MPKGDILAKGGFGIISEHPMGIVKKSISSNDGMDFLMELDIMSTLCDVGIVKITDYDISEDNKVKLIMERAKCDLDEFIEQRVISYDFLIKIMVDILLGLYNLHYNNILHNDMKPANVLLFKNKEKDEYEAKICDFGFCQHRYPGITGITGVVTSLYRAPEIFLDRNYDYTSDIWSMGCLLYYFLTKDNMVQTLSEDDVKIFEDIFSRLPKESFDYNLMKLMFDKSRSGDIKSENIEKLGNISRKTWKEKITFKTFRKNINISGKDGDVEKIYEELLLMLTKMMHVDPRKRGDTLHWLSHKLFEKHRDYIDYSIQRIEYHYIHPEKACVFNKKGRELYMKEAIKLYKQLVDIPPNVFFMAVAMTDRFLSKNSDIFNDMKNIKYIPVFYTCFYISLKYNDPWNYDKPKFLEYLPNKYSKKFKMDKFLELEKIIVSDMLETSSIYSKSPISYIEEDFNGEDIDNLFVLYCGNKNLYKKYENAKDFYNLYSNELRKKELSQKDLQKHKI